jgi:hypothetical protein
VGCCECGDEPSGSGATELVGWFSSRLMQSLNEFLCEYSTH